ncbi:polysaccharide deacetylase family protein [Arhodomonas aquaeolei]|uniref:polysaccharide deacetylase family protein n=1 Tax=Arhodomonas aquaeolei TaxID=2369 RepID=UPI0021683E10|nr:polysaccharide deacetylase family protein [Arhodomonas aquaeolei]MCS4503040.1 polysaccharide deacetylase family protein [Arhodomonas aquaeolei]
MSRSIPSAAPPVSVLMYHQVGPFAPPASHRAGYCHVRRFGAQMAWLRRFGYHVIGLDRLLDGLFGDTPLPPRAVVLTFDDGYENFREHAWPILRRHGFPATVFLVAERVGGRAEWLGDGQTRAALMGADTVRALHAEGVTFGSHTLSHPRLSRLEEADQRREIVDSKARLEDILGAEVRHFCYPYGDYDARSRNLVAEAGYASGLTCIRGAANTADNPLEIPRKAISYGDNLIGYLWKLHAKHARKDRGGAARAA